MRHEELSFGEIIGPLLRLTGFYIPASHLENEGNLLHVYLPLLSQGDGEMA